MFDTTTIVVSVVALLSVFLQPGVRAHSIKDSASEADTSSQLKQEWKFQVEENMHLRDDLKSEKQRINTLENVIGDLSAEIEEKNKRLQMRGTADYCVTPSEVIFVLDASANIKDQDFKKQLDLINSVMWGYLYYGELVRFGLVTFGEDVRVEFGPSRYIDSGYAAKAVSKVKQLWSTGVRTDLALQKMRETMRHDKRSNARLIAVVITGEPDYPERMKAEAEKARSEDIILFAVGLGPNVNLKELEAIATNKQFVFMEAGDKHFESTLHITACT